MRVLSVLFFVSVLMTAMAQSPERPTEFSWDKGYNFSLRPSKKGGEFNAATLFQNHVDSLTIMQRESRVAAGGYLSSATSLPPIIPDLEEGSYQYQPSYRYVAPFQFDHNQIMVSPLVGVSPVVLWPTGGIMAMGSRNSYPGLMGVESGSITMYQQFGNVGVTLEGSVDKYAGFRSLLTRYSVGGSIDWRINDTFSLHTFGTYVPGSRRSVMNAASGNMGMVGYMGTTNIGGFLSVDFSERFGVDVGGQGYYNMATGKWDAQPILQPYVKLDNGAKIGVDVGGILYQILRSNSGNNWGPHNPTLGPPIPMGPPPVR